MIHYGPGGALEPGLATAGTEAEDDLSLTSDLREVKTNGRGAIC